MNLILTIIQYKIILFMDENMNYYRLAYYNSHAPDLMTLRISGCFNAGAL